MGNAGARLGIQLGFAVVGALIGDATGFAIGGLVGGIVGSLLFPIEQPNQFAEGPKLGDLSIQTSTYGNAIPVIYGTCRVAGNVIWSTGLIEHANTVTQEIEGGKGGSSPTSTVTTYTYTASFAISLCNNEIIGIKRIWADDKLWYDFADPPVGVSFYHTLYTGTEDQLPDAAIEADKGVGNVPAFRGQAYIVFKDLDLTIFGNRIPNFHFEVVSRGSLSLTPQFLFDSPGEQGWFRRVAIDEETGLVWYTSQIQNTIRVCTPDLTLVKEIVNEMSHPYHLSYQPPYTYMHIPFGPAAFVETPGPREMPPRMWCGHQISGLIGIGGASYSTIETRTYKVILNNQIRGIPDNVFQPHGGFAEVDRRTIKLEDIHMLGNQKVHCSGLVFNNQDYVWSIGPGGWGAGGANLLWNEYLSDPTWQSQGLGTIDMTVNDRGMFYGYHLFSNGAIWAFDEYGNPLQHCRHVNDFANILGRICWDKFERKVYQIVYDKDDPSYPVKLLKLSEDLQTVHWTVTRPLIQAWATVNIHPTTGGLYALSKDFAGNWRLHEIDKATGDYLNNGADGYQVLNTSQKIWMHAAIYPNSMFMMVGWNGGGGSGTNGIAKVPLTPAAADDPPTLQQVVEDISLRTGLLIGDVDASALSADIVKGYALAQRMPARTAIEPLMRGYFFDAVESDFVAKFVKRGGASVKTISYLDLNAREAGGQNGPQVERTRLEENEMPYQVDVNYLDPVSFYKINVQYARRLIGQSKQTVQVNIPVVFTSTEARRIADVLMYSAWIERQTAIANTTRKYLDLDPSDVVTVMSDPNLPLLDNFDRPNESPTSKWLPIPNGGSGAIGMDVIGGTLRGTPADFRALIYPQPFYPDLDIEVTIGWMDNDTNAGIGLAARFARKDPATWDATTIESDHVEMEFDNYLDGGVMKGYVIFWQYYNGSWANLGDTDGLPAFKYGDRIRASFRGNQMYGYVNDVRVGQTATPTNVLTGDFCGLASWESETEIREVRIGPHVVSTSQDYRITRAEYTAPNQYQLTLVEEDTSAYTQHSVGVDNEVPVQTIPELAPVVTFFLDTAIFGRQQDDNAGFYFAGAPSFGANWPGAVLFRSEDGGVSYQQVTTYPDEATAGVANSTLGYEGSIP